LELRPELIAKIQRGKRFSPYKAEQVDGHVDGVEEVDDRIVLITKV